MSLDQTDKRILAILEGNARTSVTEIGRKIGLSRTAVQDRLSKLESTGVIAGYHARISDAGDSLIRALIFVKIAVRPCDDALNWLASLNGVQEVISISGDLDAIVRCALPDTTALAALNDKIGQSKLITSSHSSLIYRVLP